VAIQPNCLGGNYRHFYFCLILRGANKGKEMKNGPQNEAQKREKLIILIP